MINERLLRRGIIILALIALGAGLAASFLERSSLANWIWIAGTAPVIAALCISMVRDLLSGRMGVDAVAFVAMVAAVILGAGLAAIVVAIMYAGGNVLEDFAVARAERDLKSLVDRAPRIAHLSEGGGVRDVAVDAVKVGDRILVRAGEIVPVPLAIVPAATNVGNVVVGWAVKTLLYVLSVDFLYSS